MIGLALSFIIVVTIFGGIAWLVRQVPPLAGWPAQLITGVCVLIIVVVAILMLAALLGATIHWPVTR